MTVSKKKKKKKTSRAFLRPSQCAITIRFYRVVKLSTSSYFKYETQQNKSKKNKNSDRGNRTPGCRVRDGDVNHYTISDLF